MAAPQEIAIIGAGSPIFTTEVVRDIMYTPTLAGSELVLQDINKERLEAITIVCQRFAKELGVDIRVRSTQDRVAAIDGAHFVVNSALAGGKEDRSREKHAVAEATGIYGPIEAHAPYKQLRLMWDIALDIAKYSPKATLINAANPLPEGGTLIHRETGIKFIGVCQGSRDFDHMIRVMGMRPELSQVKVAGLNHNVWVTEFLYQGADAYPILDQWIQTVSESFYNFSLPRALTYDYQLTPVAVSMYRDFGLFPAGDTVRAQTPEVWYYHDSPETEQAWFGPTGGRESENGSARNNDMRSTNLQRIEEASRTTKGSVRSIFPTKPGGQMVPIMDSMANDTPSIQQVNVANNGAIAGLPDDLVVEFPALVDARGVHSQGTITLPSGVMMGSIIPRWLQAERHVAAIRNGNDRFLVDQIRANHKVPDLATAEKILQVWKDLDPNMARHYANSPKPYTR